jgi:hypothetical protein
MYGYNLVDTPWVLFLRGNGRVSLDVHVMPNTDAAATTATCDFLLRLLAPCEGHARYIRGGHPNLLNASHLLHMALLYLSFSTKAEAVFEKSL